MRMKLGYFQSQNIPGVFLTFLKLHLYDYLEKVKKNNLEQLTIRRAFLSVQTIDKKWIFSSHAFIDRDGICYSLLHKYL